MAVQHTSHGIITCRRYEDAQDEEVMELPRPSDLPEDWAQMITKRGRIFYVKYIYYAKIRKPYHAHVRNSHRTQSTQWNDPRISTEDPRYGKHSRKGKMPLGWECALDAQGEIYFVEFVITSLFE